MNQPLQRLLRQDLIWTPSEVPGTEVAQVWHREINWPQPRRLILLRHRVAEKAALLVAGEELTSRRCEVEFGVTRPVTAKDFAALVRLGLAEKVGSGRSTRYRLKSRSES